MIYGGIGLIYIKAAIGSRICQYRKSLKITQAEAAERCQMELELYQKIERGEENFKVTDFELIVNGLGIVYNDIRLDFHMVG